MLKKLKENWHRFTHGAPGERFERRYDQRRRSSRGGMGRWLAILAGALLSVVGIILMPAPGPGVLVFIAGAGLIAQESLVAARLLDRAELFVRGMTRAGKAYWAHFSTPVKATLAATAVLVLAGCGFGVWQLFSDA